MKKLIIGCLFWLIAQPVLACDTYIDGICVDDVIIQTRTPDCSSYVTEGWVCWDTDDDKLYIGDGTTAILGGMIGGAISAGDATFTTVETAGDFEISDQFITVDTVSEIQPAIDALEAAAGGTVFIMPGIYDLNGTGLTIAAGESIILQGSGTGTGGQGTRIDDDSGIFLLTIGETGNQTTNEQVVVRDIRFYGDSPVPGTGAGIRIINHSAGVTLRNIKSSFHLVGVQIESEGAGNATYNVRLESSLIEDNTTGVWITTVTNGTTNFVNDVNISNSHFADNATHLHLDRNATTGQVAHHKVVNTYFDDATPGNDLLDMDNADNCHFTNVVFDGVAGNEIVNLDASSNNNSFVGVSFDGNVSNNGTSNIFITDDITTNGGTITAAAIDATTIGATTPGDSTFSDVKIYKNVANDVRMLDVFNDNADWDREATIRFGTDSADSYYGEILYESGANPGTLGGIVLRSKASGAVNETARFLTSGGLSMVGGVSAGDATFTEVTIAGTANPTLDLNPAHTGTAQIIDIIPSAVLSVAGEWDGIHIDGSALDPSVVGVDIHGAHIDLSGVDETNAPHFDGFMVSLPSGSRQHAIHIEDGHIQHTKTLSSDAGTEFSGIDQSIDVNAMVSTSSYHGLSVSIQEGTPAGSVAGLATRNNIDPIKQFVGTLATPSQTEFAGELHTGGTVWSDGIDGNLVFAANVDSILVGGAVVFSDIEVDMNVSATKDIKPLFYYSTGAATWTQFFPNDNTNGFQNDGQIFWNIGDISALWTNTGDPGGIDTTAGYWIKIARNRVGTVGSPSFTTVKTESPTVYSWDKNGRIYNLGVSATDSTFTNISATDVTFTDTKVTGNLVLPVGSGASMNTSGQLKWNATNGGICAYDTTYTQVVVGESSRQIVATITKPLDLTEADTLGVWQNDTGFTFNISSIKAYSDTDNVDFTLKEVNNDEDWTDLTTIEAIAVDDNGTGVYFKKVPIGDIDHTAIEDGHWIVFDNNATDDPASISITIRGSLAST